MTINACVWIDHHRAVVVLLTDDNEDMLHIRADRVGSARSAAGSRAKNSATANGFLGDAKLEQNVELRLRDYFDEVIATVHDAQAILILGPGEAKLQFRRRIATQKIGGHIAEMNTVPRLPDEQISEYVRQHFQ
jgi:hypothetical protein